MKKAGAVVCSGRAMDNLSVSGCAMGHYDAIGRKQTLFGFVASNINLRKKVQTTMGMLPHIFKKNWVTLHLLRNDKIKKASPCRSPIPEQRGQLT